MYIIPAQTPNTNRGTGGHQGPGIGGHQRAADCWAPSTSGHQTDTGSTWASRDYRAPGRRRAKAKATGTRHQRAPDGHRIHGGQPRLPGTGAAAGKGKGEGNGHQAPAGTRRALDPRGPAATTGHRGSGGQRQRQRKRAPGTSGHWIHGGQPRLPGTGAAVGTKDRAPDPPKRFPPTRTPFSKETCKNPNC